MAGRQFIIENKRKEEEMAGDEGVRLSCKKMEDNLSTTFLKSRQTGHQRQMGVIQGRS